MLFPNRSCLHYQSHAFINGTSSFTYGFNISQVQSFLIDSHLLDNILPTFLLQLMEAFSQDTAHISALVYQM